MTIGNDISRGVILGIASGRPSHQTGREVSVKHGADRAHPREDGGTSIRGKDIFEMGWRHDNSKLDSDQTVPACEGELSDLPATLVSLEIPAQLSTFHQIEPALGTIACHDVAALKARKGRLESQGTTLVAVRHGQSVANTQGQSMSGRGDSPLTEEGRQQAEQAADKMLQQLGGQSFLEQAAKDPGKLPVVYASPLSRAFDTAKALQARIPGLEIEVDPDLIEIDFGQCEGRQPGDVSKVYANFGKGVDFTHRFPGGEAGLDVMIRMDRFLSKVEDRHPGQTVLYYAHTMTVGIGSMLLGGVSHNDKGQAFVDRHSIPNAAPFVLAQAPAVLPQGPSPEEYLIAR